MHLRTQRPAGKFESIPFEQSIQFQHLQSPSPNPRARQARTATVSEAREASCLYMSTRNEPWFLGESVDLSANCPSWN